MDFGLDKLNEPVLEDDYPMYPGYMYIVDSLPTRYNELYKITVGDFKRKFGKSEVRRCDITGRDLW